MCSGTFPLELGGGGGGVGITCLLLSYCFVGTKIQSKTMIPAAVVRARCCFFFFVK